MRNHFKAYTRATWRAGRAFRGGDFAAAERWDRYAERQLKLASVYERALDEAALRQENEPLDIATLDPEDQRNTASRKYWVHAPTRNTRLQQEIDKRAAEPPAPDLEAERQQMKGKLDDLIARMERDIAAKEE